MRSIKRQSTSSSALMSPGLGAGVCSPVGFLLLAVGVLTLAGLSSLQVVDQANRVSDSASANL